jgi:hypothetical protein
MKSIIVVLIFISLFLSISNSNAQLIKSYGLKIGTATATQSFDYNSNLSFDTEYRWGYDIGAFVEFFNIPQLSLLTEMHYIQKGYEFTFEETTITNPEGSGNFITHRTRVDYLSIPILGKVRYETPSVTPYICFGPRFDFLLSKSNESTNYNSTELGGTFGGGIQFSVITMPKFLIEGRFSPGFTNALNNQNLTIKNRSFEFLVGMEF